MTDERYPIKKKGGAVSSLFKRTVTNTDSWKSSNRYMSLSAEERAKRFAEVFGAVDRVLTAGDAKEVVVLNPQQVSLTGGLAAFTDGETVYINPTKMPALDGTLIPMLTWMGINVHELGHIMYSPRANSALVRKIDGAESTYPGLGGVLQLMEDARSERLVGSQFSSYVPALEAVVGHYLGGMALPGTDLWPHLAGRTWLDPQVRASAKAAYTKGGGDSDKVAELIGKYQRLSDPGRAQVDKAYRLVVNLYKQLQRDGQHPENGMADSCSGGLPSGDGSRSVRYATEGAPMPAEAGSDGQPVAGSKDDPTSPQPDEGQGSGGQGQGQGEKKDSDEGGGKGQDQGDENDQGIKPSKGAGKAKVKPVPLKDIPNVLRNHARSEVWDNNELWDEMRSMQKAIAPQFGNWSSITASHDSNLKEAPPEIALLSQDLEIQFRSFTDRTLPYWERRTDHGKLNVARYLAADRFDYDTMFDRFDPGMQDDLSLDVTLLVDVSSSMEGRLIVHASEAMWAIWRAVDAVGGDTTILLYNGQSFSFVQTGTRPNQTLIPYIRASGGTDPKEAIDDTYRRLQGVDAAHKIVVTITDGSWGGSGTASMKELTEAGVTTVGVLLDESLGEDNVGSNWKSDYHMTQYIGSVAKNASNLNTLLYQVMGDPLALPELFAEVVTTQMRKVMEGKSYM